MRHVAVIGSGPAGYYTAEAVQKRFGDAVRIDIIDRLPVPFGLIRTGVAPDHQSIKAVSRRYEAVALTDNVRFVGHVTVGRDIGIAELAELYDAVVLATGAPADRPLGIAGDDLPGVIGSAAFVGWYNGHPDFSDLDPPVDVSDVVVIGNGNVALDIARILSKSRAEFAGSDIVAHALERLASPALRQITIVGRRGPHQIAMTPKELGELSALERARPVVDRDDLPPASDDEALEPGLRKSVGHLRAFAEGDPASRDKPVVVHFDFFARPVAIEGDDRVERLVVERIRVSGNGQIERTGENYAIPCGLVISAIGYKTVPIPGVPYDEAFGRFTNVDGRIAPGIYAVGWARRGPTGTIGTNRPDGYMIADMIATDLPEPQGKPGRPALDALLQARGVEAVTFRDWQKIEAAEIARARTGAPREKFVAIPDMLQARKQ